jgi:hypothetical protein
MVRDKFCIVYDSRFGSMMRPPDNRVKESNPRWSQPRFLERLENEIPTILVDICKNPPPDAKVVWFAIPDPQPVDVIKQYDHWEKNSPGVITINPPILTYRPKELWFRHLNEFGVRAPMPNRLSKFNKTQFHGYGPTFQVEYIHSIPQNHTGTDTRVPNNSQYHKVWRLVVFNGVAGSQCARLEGDGFWVQSGSAEHVREIFPTPAEYQPIAEKVTEMSGLKYFHIEIIPSPWAGPVVCDVNPHPFDVMEGRLNDVIHKDVVETLKRWLSEG